MRVASLLFCEYAATTREGKLDAGGILNLIWSPTFPFEASQLFLVVTLELDTSHYGVHDFQLNLEQEGDPGRRSLLEQSFDAGGRFHRIGVNLAGVAFGVPGVYLFRAIVDGADLGDASLVVSDREPEYPGGVEG